MFHRIEHTALSVTDMDRSLAFYRDLIGMEEVLDVDFSDERLGVVNGLAGCKARVVHLKLGPSVLELFEYREPRGRDLHQRQCDLGYMHIGFRVTNIHELHRSLTANGVKFFSEPLELRPGTFIVYFQGPDGEICEMRQVGNEE